MFVETGCFHRFHKTCFKLYATQRLTASKKKGNNNFGDVEFFDPVCKRCDAKVHI